MEDLTDDEVAWMTYTARHNAGMVICPDCQTTPFLYGPSGPGVVNVKCSDCEHYFNISDCFLYFPYAHRLDRGRN